MYIDDIFIITRQEEGNEIEDLFIQKFLWITMETSTTLSYLGIVLKIHQDHL